MAEEGNGQAWLRVAEVAVREAIPYVAWNTAWQKDVQNYTGILEEKDSTRIFDEKGAELMFCACCLEDSVGATIRRFVPWQWFDQSSQSYIDLFSRQRFWAHTKVPTCFFRAILECPGGNF